MHKILITGATGFVAHNLYTYLSAFNRYRFLILSRSTSLVNSNSQVMRSTLDAFFQSENQFATDYIHLAGKAHDLKNISDESEYFSVNYDLTKRLFDRFVHDDEAKTFIFVSSVKAVADTVEGYLNEDYIPKPATAYGRSKLAAEQYILDNIPCDRTVVILRPCMIHGPGNKGNLNLLHSIVSRGVPWPLGNFDNNRSFLSIDNFCYVIEQILDGNVSTGVYNLADDEPLSTLELVNLISKVENKKSKIWNIPRSVIKGIAKIGNILPLPLNEERLDKLTEDYLVSNQKIKAELRIDKMPMSAKNGMLKTLNSFKK